MTRLIIDTGTLGNPATGDSLRTAMIKINDNFSELYTSSAADGNLTTDVTNGDISIKPNGTGTVEIDALSVNSDNITSLTTNSSVTITGNGTAGVDIEALSITGTSISSSDSSTININDNLLVDGTGTFQSGATIDGVSITDNTISTGSSNANLELTASGTGAVKVDAILSLPDGSDSDNYVGVGDADDLKIFHNGSHSIIRETGTGNLFLQSDNNVIIGKDSGSETMIKGVADGAVELYHDNVKKLNTSSSGVTVVDELHTEGATPHLTLKRTDNANVPTVRFKGSGGTVGASIDFQGTGGTSNELAFQVFDGSSLAERFRVTYTGAKVSGSLNVDGGISITDNTITSAASNADLEINASGTGTVVLENLKVGTGATVTTILDEDNMSSNSATALATQQSIKAYVDSESGTGDFTFVGSTMSSPSNADVDITPGGTGNVNLNGDTVRLGDNDADATITTQGTGDLILNTNAGTNSGTITLRDGSNGDIILEPDGTGDVLLKGNKVGIGTVNQPDTLLHLKDTNAVITLQRTADANTPGLSFQQSGGNVRGVIKLDGTSGVSNEIFMQTYDGSSLAERFRVTHTGAKVSGTLNVDGGINIADNIITTSASNADLELEASGTGQVVANAALKFNAGYIEKINSLTSSSTITVNCALASIHTVTLDTNTGFVITNLPTGGTVTLIITQDGTGSRTATFGTDGSTAVKFPGGSSTLSTGANDIDVVTIVNDGTNFLGNCAKDYS